MDKPPPTPRWALWKPFDIYARDGSGDVYLHRLRVVQTPLFAIYLHDVNAPDPDRDAHDHPWTFYSLILRGGYVEEVFNTSSGDPVIIKASRYVRRWLPWTIHKMTMDRAHRIIEAWPNTRTLVITGRRRREFNFWTDDGPVQWRDYLQRGDTSDYPADVSADVSAEA